MQRDYVCRLLLLVANLAVIGGCDSKPDRDEYLRANIVGDWKFEDDEAYLILRVNPRTYTKEAQYKGGGLWNHLVNKDLRTFSKFQGEIDWMIVEGIFKNVGGGGAEERVEMPDRSTLIMTPILGHAPDDPNYAPDGPKRFIRIR